MSGHNKDAKKLEKIMAVCPTCSINGNSTPHEFEYIGDMIYKERRIPHYHGIGCHTCATLPTLLKLNPGLTYNKKE